MLINMLNFALISKILEIAGEPEEIIDRIMADLVNMVVYKFRVDFVLFINDRVESDHQLEELSDFIENIDNLTESKFQEYKKWLDNNIEFDISEFWDKFEQDMQDMEMDLVDKIKDELKPEQKEELIRFMDKQNDDLKGAYTEVAQSFEEIEDDLK